MGLLAVQNDQPPVPDVRVLGPLARMRYPETQRAMPLQPVSDRRSPRTLAAMTRPWVSGQHHHLRSGAFVREVLGSVVFPLRPLVVGVCELAQEGCGPVPAVGHAFGPCPELRGEVTFLYAAVGRG